MFWRRGRGKEEDENLDIKKARTLLKESGKKLDKSIQEQDLLLKLMLGETVKS